MAGLRRDVRLTWTEGGVPHLAADSAADLFFAQGYVTAAERLFQLDLARRAARGELAEIFGPRPAPWAELSVVFRGSSLVDVDHFMRQLALGPAARASLEALPPETQAFLEAYAAGVNAWLEEGPRPLECQLLGYTPRPWTAADCAVAWKALSFQLSYGWRAGLAAEALRARFPDAPHKARALLPDQRQVSDVMLPRWPGASLALTVLENVAGKGGPAGPGLGGSNGWVVAPGRTASGRALLCGDPHLPLRAPAPGYLVHLKGGGFDVAGWSVPGIPGIVMGHNDRVAWTLTNGCILDAAWTMEQLSADGAQVRTSRGFEPLEEEPVDIFVRGQAAPVRKRLRHGPNGPIFDDALLGGGPDHHALSLRWTGHLPTPDLDAILLMNRAAGETGLRAAAAKYGSPAVNVLSADVDGHVGWFLAGIAPRFQGRPPLGLVPGWAPEHEWDGLHPTEAMPSLTDPPDGFIASANQRLLPTSAAVQLGELFEPPYRARRLRAVLGETTKLTLDAAQALQQDRRSGFGLDLQERFLKAFAARTVAAADRLKGPAAQVLAHALAWDGEATPESAGAAAAWAFTGALARGLFEPLLGDRLFFAVFEQHNLPMLPLLRVLAADGAPFWSRDELDRAARAALEAAAKTLAKACGARSARWRLGALRTVTMRHPMSDAPGLGRLVTLGPVAHGGDGSTVNAAFSPLGGDGAVEVGPVFRHAVEVGAWDDYRVVLATGQSGDPTTLRYRDHFPVWRAGGHFVLPFGDDAVAKGARARATLVPEKKP